MAEQEQPEAMAEQNPSEMLDKIMDNLPEEAPDSISPLDEALETQTEETTPVEVPDEGMMMQLFEIVHGGAYDASSPVDQQRLAQIESLLSQDPDLLGKLNSGEMSMTEFAIRVYRDSPDNPAAIA